MTQPGLHVLSLDGGGISVLSELLIVKELMARIGARRGLSTPPRPHEYFQWIGGTGTGGLVAILLGRLKLDIGEAIECWLNVMRTVFTQKKSHDSEGAFKATALEQAISDIVAKYGEGDGNMIRADRDEKCKVIVYALNADAIRAGIPTSIRTYRSYSNQGPECTIVEAVRATMATPGIFKPKVINDGGVAQTYAGGNLVVNNPTAQLLTEVEPEQPIASIISIGAGQLRSARLTNPRGVSQKLPTRLAAALKTIAEDCEKVSEDMSRRFEEHEGYYRFNVEQGMQDLDPNSPDQMGDAKAHTSMYLKLRDPDTKMNKAVKKITNGNGTILIKGGNVFAADPAYLGLMSEEPESVTPGRNDLQMRPPTPTRTESDPVTATREHQTMERLMSLGVPGHLPWVNEPQSLRYEAH